MKPPGPFFHLGTITGPQSKCLIPHNAPNCSYNKPHSLVFPTCEGRWMRIENMAVLRDEERGPAPAVCSQRTWRRVIYKPQCPNLSTQRESSQESWEKACSVPIVKAVHAVWSDICALLLFFLSSLWNTQINVSRTARRLSLMSCHVKTICIVLLTIDFFTAAIQAIKHLRFAIFSFLQWNKVTQPRFAK